MSQNQQVQARAVTEIEVLAGDQAKGPKASLGLRGRIVEFGRILKCGFASPKLIFLTLILLSLPPRLTNLSAPLTGEHELRQTQTAISVWEIREHGLDLLHPRLPLFGPPWECPFEYPVFQIAAAAVDGLAPWTNLDVSIRVTNLVFFYLTAVMLGMLARSLFGGSATALLTVAVFLFSPYNVLWSRSSMIEYAATFLGPAYLYGFIHWTLKPTRLLFCVTLCLGILGCLTKVTSFVLPLLTACVIGSLNVFQFLRGRWVARKSREAGAPSARNADVVADIKVVSSVLPAVHPVLTALLLLLPLVVGYAYIRFGDSIKEQMEYTAWLSSRHPYTRAWTYGTWGQRLKFQNWDLIRIRLLHTTLPALSLALSIGFCVLPFRVRYFRRLPWGNVVVGLSLCLAPFVGIFLFYNLYVVHSYYLIACVPFLALFVGVGLALAFDLLPSRFVRLLLVLLLIGLGLREWSGRLGTMMGTPTPVDSSVTCLAQAGRIIGKDEPVIVVSPSEWSAFVPYYLKRRAFMAMLFNKPVNIQPLLDRDYFKKSGFRWLLVDGGGRDVQDLAARIMKQWKTATLIPLPRAHLYFLYALSDG